MQMLGRGMTQQRTVMAKGVASGTCAAVATAGILAAHQRSSCAQQTSCRLNCAQSRLHSRHLGAAPPCRWRAAPPSMQHESRVMWQRWENKVRCGAKYVLCMAHGLTAPQGTWAACNVRLAASHCCNPARVRTVQWAVAATCVQCHATMRFGDRLVAWQRAAAHR